MAQIRVERDTLSEMLRSHGEDDLAARASSITDDELTRIRTLGAYYAWFEDALALRGQHGRRARSRWPRSTCSSAPDAIYGVTTPTLRLRSDGQRSPTGASVAEIVSCDFMPRRNSCPTRAAERRRTRTAGAVLRGCSRTLRPRAFGYRLLTCLSPSAQTFRRPAGS
jgi:hypothetical protein